MGACHPRQGILRSEVSLSKGEKTSTPETDSFHSYKSSGINNTGMVLAQGNITYRQHSDEPRINTKIVKLIYQAKKFSSDMKENHSEKTPDLANYNPKRWWWFIHNQWGHWNASFWDCRGTAKRHKLQKTDMQDGQSLLLRASSKYHTFSFRKAERKSIFIRLHKGWATLPSPWLRLKAEPNSALALLQGLGKLFPFGHWESYLIGIMHPAHWICAYLEIITASKKIIHFGLCRRIQIVQYCFHTPQIVSFKMFFFSDNSVIQPPSIHPSIHTTGQTVKGWNTNKTITKALRQLIILKRLMEPDITL